MGTSCFESPRPGTTFGGEAFLPVAADVRRL
jgi:hypothetical protein